MRRAVGDVEAAELFLVIGTSAVVYPAAGPIPLAIEAGVPVISIRGKAGEVLPQLSAFA